MKLEGKMASFVIHLAIGEAYLKNYKVKNRADFIKGVKAPDILGLQGFVQKGLAHFSDMEERGYDVTLAQSLRAKVNLYRYLHSRQIDSDYELGYFLHLVTDYYFFNYFINADEFHNDHHEFKNLYEDYSKVADRVVLKYGVDNTNNPWSNISTPGEPKLFTLDEIFEFIDKCGKLNLMNIREVVLESTPSTWRENIEPFYIKAD